MTPWRALALACAVGAGGAGSVLAQPGIYTCTDAQGRRITSDRPILECIDRTQKELNPSGTVRRQIGPSLTAAERAQIEARERKAAEDQARANEEVRRNRALLSRYRDKAAHDRARAEALAQIDDLQVTTTQRLAELDKQRVALDRELEFYQGAPDKLPSKLRRQIEEHESSVAAQKRFMADQQADRKRLNDRFDEELARLRQLWADQGGAAR